MLKKISLMITAAAGLLLAGVSQAATSTVDTIATDLAPVLNNTVQAIIATFISFVSANLPLIVVLGVTVGLIWMFINRTKGAIHGR